MENKIEEIILMSGCVKSKIDGGKVVYNKGLNKAVTEIDTLIQDEKKKALEDIGIAVPELVEPSKLKEKFDRLYKLKFSSSERFTSDWIWNWITSVYKPEIEKKAVGEYIEFCEDSELDVPEMWKQAEGYLNGK